MTSFKDAFEKRLQQSVSLSEAAAPVIASEGQLDHPQFLDLGLGQSMPGEAAVLFVDIRRYTRLAMAYSEQPEKVGTILDAVIGASIESLMGYGAHINDFTGDGVMAIFGGSKGSLTAAHDNSIWAVTRLMTEMSATLRGELLGVDITDPVQIAIGLVSGPVLWRRIGTPEASRVMAVGEIAPLAAKYVSGSETKAWEVMIGGAVIPAVPVNYRTKVADFERQHDSQAMRRERWLLDTSRMWNDAGGSAEGVKAIRDSSMLGAGSLGAIDPALERTGSGTRRESTIG